MSQPIDTDAHVERLPQASTEQEVEGGVSNARAPKQALKFLKLLDPTAKAFTFQTFGEGSTKGETELTEILHGPLDRFLDEFELLNEAGAGIFVTVNETDLKGRKAGDIKRVRAVWCDYDSEKQAELKTLDELLAGFPLPPSIVVSTSEANFHFYWLVADGLGPLPFRWIMDRMVESYRCDPSACDLARVLRVPGYTNNKRQGWLVSITKNDATGTRYTRAQLLEAFPPLPTKEATLKDMVAAPEQTTADWDQEAERLIDALRHVSAADRDTWLRVGFAIYDASGGSSEGFKFWDDWSQTTKAGNYSRPEQDRYWNIELPKRSARVANRVTLASIFRLALNQGWIEQREPLKPVVVPEAVAAGGGELTAKAIATMRQTYCERGLSPSEAQWEGIQHAIAVMEQMADGRAANVVHLSPLDPGMGKTQSVSHFIPELLDSEKHKDVSALICVGRLNEIPQYIEEMGLDARPQEFSVKVSDDKKNDWLNDLGNQKKTEARVMFTTQQLVESRSKRSENFASISEFNYRGKPREVRVWDEAILPARPVLLDVTRIEGLTNPLKARDYDELFRVVNEILASARAAKTDDLVTIPNLTGESQFDFYAFIQELKEDEEKSALIAAAEDLAYLSGKTVRVHRDNRKVCTLLDYQDTLADDLAPILVMDASGRVRTTYSYWGTHRGGIVKLTEVKKSYRNLTCHVWHRGSSRTAWRNDYDGDLVREIVKEIRREPDKRCLVIHPMARGRVDVKKAIERRIAEDKIETGVVKFLHWGDHAASNDYREYNKVILSTLFYRPPAYYDAMARLSMGLKSEDPLTREQRDEINRGEHADAILQAVCRASVRKPLGDGCHPCDVYIIASRRTGIEDDLPQIFPDCKIVKWAPIPRELSGHQKRAYDFVRKWFQTKSDDLRLADVLKAIGVSRYNFDVSDDLESMLGENGIFYFPRRGPLGSYFGYLDLS